MCLGAMKIYIICKCMIHGNPFKDFDPLWSSSEIDKSNQMYVVIIGA